LPARSPQEVHPIQIMGEEMSQKDHAIERLCEFLRDAIEHWDYLAEASDSEGLREASKARASVARKLIAEAEAATNLLAN
jgi:hypothetical protein